MNVIAVLGALMGAAGVVLAAAAAHVQAPVRLEPAAQLLLAHAPMVFIGISVLDRGLIARPLGLLALGGFVLGCVLFAGDLALRAFAGVRLFAWAAPAGGVLLLASWLSLAAAALIPASRAA
jgi:uncharacterized membrane protein YgdD (TMEM256/DUF423 family)